MSPASDNRRGRAGRGRRRPAETEATAELRSLAGPRAARAVTQLQEAGDAYAAGREQEAARTLRSLRDLYPDAAAVRELLGLCLYRLGHYKAAARELEAFVDLTGSTEQHPVLMDCHRAQRRHREVARLWEELRAASPSGELVTEGRIVMGGALADRGDTTAAIRLLERRARDVRQPREHDLRLWYALADLLERAGELPAAKTTFERIRRHDPGFADVAERLSALG
jgi:tetratricopeptide (TPR) repeat protein